MKDQELSREDVCQNLRDAGFAPEAVAGFLDCWSRGKRCEQMRILSRQRQYLLDRIHCREKQISCLDYLSYQLSRQEEIKKDNGR
ncbi:hypothetical protein H6B15_00990 [Gemmiger formicilis]|uniref:hypothetical protein n=1 Tax=Gemmiger formicilis TaxID=745368 RepID=UPI0019598DF3|nr:hypothetical protein [Gemmiger formicilis]MBM6715241.1 hypothetical protein [Gemmiger formicilis]